MQPSVTNARPIQKRLVNEASDFFVYEKRRSLRTKRYIQINDASALPAFDLAQSYYFFYELSIKNPVHIKEKKITPSPRKNITRESTIRLNSTAQVIECFLPSNIFGARIVHIFFNVHKLIIMD